jgi:glycosyltransferase involved in cell wall biosynthesis
MRLRFITSTPLEVSRGSGTFVGITTLAVALRALGVTVESLTPKIKLPIYTAQRLFFNETLRWRQLAPVDVTVGFDMDGYTLSRANTALNVASIKGVIADEMRFESGLTRATMRIQAACERKHVQRADAVVTTSRYSAERIQALYALSAQPHIVPELIDLQSWTKLLESVNHRGVPHFSPPLREVESTPARFTILSVCRFYPRKRLDVLLAAAARLLPRIPNLEVRIVGGGPESTRLKKICRDKNLDAIVTFRENISQSELAREYQACDVFCLPSVQEGFGIVFLEAMAAGKPIIAARAAAVPEVVQQGLLADPDNGESLAAAIERLYGDPALRQAFADKGREVVKEFDAPVVARLFLRKMESMLGSYTRSPY